MKVEVKRRDDGMLEVQSPGVGLFRRMVEKGALVGPGQRFGALEVLSELTPLIMPKGFAGVVVEVESHRRRAVGYRSVLFVLDPEGTAGAAANQEASATTASGLVFSSPMSGRFYLRPAPDRAAFVSVGDALSESTPLGLLEVMKTFNRITYGNELPANARVKRVLVEDGADVEIGEALFELES
jgi:acetyl-CoA carboxylase biotin carboxyl carrier protein